MKKSIITIISESFGYPIKLVRLGYLKSKTKSIDDIIDFCEKNGDKREWT